jgi:hypothetical protein
MLMVGVTTGRTNMLIVDDVSAPGTGQGALLIMMQATLSKLFGA